MGWVDATYVTSGPAVPQGPVAISALEFAANGAANSDVAVVFDGSILVSRLNQMVLWEQHVFAFTGYEGATWNSPNNGAWDGGTYSVGMHDFPADTGGVDSNGQTVGGSGSGGTIHYAEIAGMLLAADFLASPSSPGPQSVFLSVASTIRRRCRLIFANGANTEHYFYPDLVNRPTEFIHQTLTTASIGAGGGSPAFYWGSSDWTASGGTNSECFNGRLRKMMIFKDMTTSDLSHAINLLGKETDSQANAYIAANGLGSKTHYVNMNPTPSDITDKSGNGRNPAWRNANRPALWTGTA